MKKKIIIPFDLENVAHIAAKFKALDGPAQAWLLGYLIYLHEKLLKRAAAGKP
jgi:hypothetical protein